MACVSKMHAYGYGWNSLVRELENICSFKGSAFLDAREAREAKIREIEGALNFF